MSVSSVSSSKHSDSSERTTKDDKPDKAEKSSQPEAPKADAGQEKDKAKSQPSVSLNDTDRFDPAPSAPRKTPPPANIDPRIASEANVQVTVQPHSDGPAGTLAVDAVRYQNDQESGGNHNVYVRVLDASGKEIPPEDMNRYFDVQYTPGPGMPVTSASPKINDPYGVQKDAWATSANSGGPTAGYFDIPMYGGNQTQVWVTPKDVPGNPYAGYGSQQVGPFSMPGNHHVNYMVTFRATPEASSGTGPASGGGDIPTAPVDPSTPQAPQQPPSTEQMVEGLYQSLLGRPSDPAGKAHWVGYANHLAEQGQSPQEVQDTLTTLFKQSDEYKAKHGTQPDPVTPPQPPAPGTGGYVPGDTLQVNAPGGLNVRSGPSANDARIGGYVDGAQLTVATPPEGGPASRDGWVYVNGPGGNNGWVNEQFVKKSGAGPVGGTGGTDGPVPTTGQPGSVYAPYNVAGNVSVNGRFGAHWPTAWDPNKPEDLQKVDSIISEMKDMGAGYTVINVSPGQVAAMAGVVQKLNAAGLTPVVRIYEPEPPDRWTPETMERMGNAAVELGKMGVGLIQLGNEPNIEGNLGNRSDVTREDYLTRSIDRQVDALVVMQQKLRDAGLSGSVKVGIPPMAAGAADIPTAFAPDTYFKAMVQAIADREKTLSPPARLVDWLPVHSYIWGDGTTTQPGNGGMGARGQMGWGPETAQYYEQWAQNALGYAPRALSTEGGPSPDTFRANDRERAKNEMQETLDQLQQDSGVTGCLWLDWESVPGSNNWDRSVFTSDDDGAWSLGLPLYRDAWHAAQGG